MSESMEDLTAVLAEAADKLPIDEQASAEDTSESSQESRARDDRGRFASREEKLEASTAPDSVATPSPEPEETTWEDRPPSSWKPAVREEWAKLPEPVRREILRREEASVLGVRHLNEQIAPYKELAGTWGQYLQDIADKGGNPAQYGRHLFEVDKRMRYANSPQEKLSTVVAFAEAYGVPLRQLITQMGAMGGEAPVIPPQPSMPPEVMRELAEMRQWRQSFVQQTASGEVEGFGADKEFFNDVRNTMADLIESGVARDLQDAYDKACWADPEVRQVLMQRERSGANVAQMEERRRAAASASLSAGGALTPPQSADDDDIGSILREEMTRSATGRV